jgi:outer membrane protein assembly factor BamB
VLEALAAAAMLSAQTLSRLPAPEASQGVAVDASYVYAVGNSQIAKYDRRSGARVAVFTGDPEAFPHMNSCAVIGRELVCAASNYPATPMLSQVEVFDPTAMTHRRTIRLGHQAGSLTWVDRRDGSWWAGFANYDGHGGEPGRDHRFTTLVRFDDQWRPHESWTFPPAVLDRMAPRSASGGTFGADGRLYVTGHDRPELYVLEVPKGGGVLKLVATVAIPVEGQAIAFDRSARGVLFGVSRARREVVAMTLPPLEAKK